MDGEPLEEGPKNPVEEGPKEPAEGLEDLSLGEAKGGTWLLEFLPESNHFRALTKAGKISQTLGRDVAGQTLLTIPEAVYLLESDRAKLVGEYKMQDVLQRLLAENAQNPDLWKAYHRLKGLGYIIEHENEMPWDLYKPDAHFRKTLPSAPLGQISLHHADDLLAVDASTTKDHYCCVTDMSYQLLLRARWVELDADRKDEEDGFCLSRNDLAS